MTSTSLQRITSQAHNAWAVTPIDRWLLSLETLWIQVARRRFLSCALVVFLTLALRLALLPVDHKPQPEVHDEFSYIFGAETLAEGRLTTPTHPLWRFFETYHINSQPTYCSKYPPGQALFLALGIRLGDPWYGVLISVALMCGSICWMLQGWVPARYALIGGVLATLQFGVTYYWIDSYWGGAVAGIGGALVMGALPRLALWGSASAACAGAIGIAILANSRPFEGAALVVPALAIFWWLARGRPRVWLRPRVALPISVILLGTIAAMAYYNFRTTGSPTTFPYAVNQQRYSAAPVFWILPPYPPRHREYRDSSMRAFWESWDVSFSTQIRRNPMLAVFHLAKTIVDALRGVGLILILLFASAVCLGACFKVRILLGACLFFLAVLSLDKFVFAHYLAPALGLFFIVAMFGLRGLRRCRLRRQPIGLRFAAVLSISAVGLFLFGTTTTIATRLHTPDTGAIGFRRLVSERLSSEPGLQLALVRYAANHDPHSEIIYNSPDIDRQKIVWAFDFGPAADRPLLDYFKTRKVWLVQPDGPDPTIEPYSGQ